MKNECARMQLATEGKCGTVSKKRLAALSMLHKAKKAYYACDVIRFLVPYAGRNRLAARTGCAVHAPCLLAVRWLP